MSGKAEVTGHGQNDAVAPYISVFPLFKKVLNPRSAPKGARGSKSVDTFRLHNVLLDEARHDGKEAYVVTVPLGSEHRCIEEKTAAGKSSHGPPDPRLFLQIAFSTVAPSLAH